MPPRNMPSQPGEYVFSRPYLVRPEDKAEGVIDHDCLLKLDWRPGPGGKKVLCNVSAPKSPPITELPEDGEFFELGDLTFEDWKDAKAQAIEEAREAELAKREAELAKREARLAGQRDRLRRLQEREEEIAARESQVAAEEQEPPPAAEAATDVDASE